LPIFAARFEQVFLLGCCAHNGEVGKYVPVGPSYKQGLILEHRPNRVLLFATDDHVLAPEETGRPVYPGRCLVVKYRTLLGG
jgi:hypothetical protein